MNDLDIALEALKAVAAAWPSYQHVHGDSDEAIELHRGTQVGALLLVHRALRELTGRDESRWSEISRRTGVGPRRVTPEPDGERVGAAAKWRANNDRSIDEDAA